MKKEPSYRIALSPPWVTFANLVKYTVGQDPHVRVGNLNSSGSNMILPIFVQCPSRAKALATIIQSNVQMGNVTVIVRVRNQGKIVTPYGTSSVTAPQIAQFYRHAFSTNSLFSFVKTRSLTPNTGDLEVFPVFKKRVVQFFNDDLSDFYNNYNNVAAFSFKSVLLNSINNIPINFSTSRN